ncbi:low density lipoprotein receptor adapter protein 1b [Callorhinchus milii]|uniref:low density lipoprotein receptor adapter protein 1b n=1 Tax=Callorhinchus milii TaxID=7868 RepID=UPI001C3FDF66|nr:low density lipoprotein receptor adapter protein 1b [Callorhinchus milii]
MDALKSAGRAIIRSPNIAKQSWGGGKHKKLPENWTDTRETLQEGMIFNLKYLGMTLVEQPKGEDMSSAAVRRIVTMAKASGKKLQKVTLTVSPRGIILRDSTSNQQKENISIYRISYCTADKAHDKVFAYIAQSQLNETLECHAFLCTKKKVAQAVTLTVAQAFKVAFEYWQLAKEEKEKRVTCAVPEGKHRVTLQLGVRQTSIVKVTAVYRIMESLVQSQVATANLLDLSDEAMSSVPTDPGHNRLSPKDTSSSVNNNVVWEMDDDLDEAFSRLAQARTNPQVLDIGMSAQDMQSEECLSPTDWEKPNSATPEKDELFDF